MVRPEHHGPGLGATPQRGGDGFSVVPGGGGRDRVYEHQTGRGSQREGSQMNPGQQIRGKLRQASPQDLGQAEPLCGVEHLGGQGTQVNGNRHRGDGPVRHHEQAAGVVGGQVAPPPEQLTQALRPSGQGLGQAAQQRRGP